MLTMGGNGSVKGHAVQHLDATGHLATTHVQSMNNGLAANFSPAQRFEVHRQQQARNAARIQSLIDRLAEMDELQQDQFLASLSAADRNSIETAMRELDHHASATKGVHAGEQLDVYLSILLDMKDEEQDAFLASLTPEERDRLHKELFATGELGDAAGSSGQDQDGSTVAAGSAASKTRSSASQSHQMSEGQVSELVSGGGLSVGRAGSIKQQGLQREHEAAMSAAAQLKATSQDAQAQRYTGSDLRVKQQLGLAPTGEIPHDQGQVDIPQPSEMEMSALVGLGYSRAQAALICVVDALTKQGYTPDEAQAHATKAAAKNIAGWYLDSGNEAQENLDRDLREGPMPNPRAPPRALLPTSSLRVGQQAQMPPDVEEGGMRLQQAREQTQAQEAAAVPAFVKLRRAADAREQVEANGTGAAPSGLGADRWERRWRSQEAEAQAQAGPGVRLAGLSLEDKATFLTTLSEEEQDRVLKELPTEEVAALFEALEDHEPGGGQLQASVFAKMSPEVQGVVMGLPARSTQDNEHRKTLLASLAPARRRAFEEFVESDTYQELAHRLTQWHKTSSSRRPAAQGATRHRWFTGLTCEQQALVLALTGEEEVDPDLNPESLMGSLSPEQVAALFEFSGSAEAEQMVEYLRQSSVEAQPVRVPSAETERGNVSFQEQGHRLAQGRRKSDFTGQRRAKFVFKDVKGVTVDVERKKKLEEELKQQESAKDERVGDPMKKLFDQFDTDKSGALDQQEFLQATELMGLSFPRTELAMMFRTADDDGTGTIDVNEFTDLVMQLRWKRMDMLTVGKWEKSTSAAVDVGGLAMMHNWEEQQAWLEKAIEVGQAASRPDGASTHIDAEKMKQFRVRLRTMFEEVDVDHSGALDLEEMRKALIGFGLHFSDDLVAELFSFCDKDGSGEVDYNEFEEAILDIFFNRLESTDESSAWKFKVVQKLQSRLRPPPPARPKWMQNQVGSVKALEDCQRHELHGQQYGEAMWLKHQTTEEHNESIVVLNVECSNLPSVRDRIFAKHTAPGFPCRPVVVLNALEPRSHVWFQAGVSNWLDGVVHPFSQTVSLEHFEDFQQFELVAYDLELSGDGGSEQEDAGTAVTGIKTLWVPMSENKRDVRKKLPRGTMHVQMIGARRLPKSDIFGLSDPFAKLTVAGQTVQTHVEMCTLDPDWGDEFEFQLYGEHSKLHVEIYDWDIENNDFLGMFEVDLEEMCTNTKALVAHETWYHLRNKDGTFVWGQQVTDEEQAAAMRRQKKELHARQSLGSNSIFASLKNKFDDYRNKFKRIAVSDARNMTATPDHSLGSIKIEHHDLMLALSHAKARRIKATAHRKASDKGLGMSALLNKEHTAGECFLEWKDLVRREQGLKYFTLGNHPDKYASLHITASDSVEGGEEKVRIGVSCKNLPKMDLVGKVDCFLKFEVQDPETKQWRLIHRTPVVEKNFNPEFPIFLTTTESDLQGRTNCQIRISAYDWDALNKPDLIGWVKTNVIELESLSRGKGTLKFKDPEQKKRYRGELVPYNCFFWRVPVFTIWHFNFHVAVHSWGPGDAFTVEESVAAQRRAEMRMYEDEIEELSRQRVRENIEASKNIER